MDNKHSDYLAEKSVVSPESVVDWGLIRKVYRTKATTTPAKALLLQAVCDVLTTRAWLWDHGIAEDRRCPCGSEDLPDHWLQGCEFATAGTLRDISRKGPSWAEVQKTFLFKARPLFEEGIGDY